MLIVDKLLFGGPIAGVKWILGQLGTLVEQEMTNEQPVMQAILENEMAFEEGRVTEAEYAETQAALMVQLREVKELKKRIAEEKAQAAAAKAGIELEAPPSMGPGKGAISGKASLEVDLDFGGWGGKGGGR